MFRRNKRQDFVEENSKRKFLLHKEPAKKFKHLKLLLDNLTNAEIRKFFEEHHSEIFHAFIDYFDVEIKNKLQILTFREAESNLLILEKLIQFLPELVSSQWQMNCILEMLQDFLSPSNPLSVQVSGMKIFMIWYQVLGENATSECTNVFIHLVPEFGNLFDTYKNLRSKNANQAIVGGDGDAQRGNRVSSNSSASSVIDEHKNSILLHYLLRFAVTESDKVYWNPSTYDRRPMCFWFIFEQLKRYYFPAIFPKISAKYSIYDGTNPSDLIDPTHYSLAVDGYTIPPHRLALYQEAVVRWLCDFLYTGPRALLPKLHTSPSGSDLLNQAGNDGATGGIRNPQSSEGSTSGVDLSSQSEHQRPGANNYDQRSTGNTTDALADPAGQASNVTSAVALARSQLVGSTSFLSVHEIRQAAPGYFAEHLVLTPQRALNFEPVLPVLAEWAPEYTQTMVTRVRDILFYSRDNINFIHAVFYYASLLPIERYKALFCLVLVYRSWLEDKPVFMKGADLPQTSVKTPPTHSETNQGSNLKDMRRRRDIVFSAVLPSRLHTKMTGQEPKSTSTQQKTPTGASHNNVGGCAQITYQVMFTNLAHIFLRTCPAPAVVTLELINRIQETPVDYTAQQIALCTLVLSTIVQPLTQSNALTTDSWEKLLFTLMHIVSEVMSNIYRTDHFDSHWVSNDRLLGKMFQTLNAACIYATLAAPISSSAWDKCLSIYSKIPDCPALFREWKKAMDFLTRQMGKIVFGVDLHDLPDETKTKRGRRALGKLTTASQYMGPPQEKLQERRGSVNLKTPDSVGPRLPDKWAPPPKSGNTEVEVGSGGRSGTPGTQRGQSLEFNLGSDEGEAASFDGAAGYSSATEVADSNIPGSPNSLDECCSSSDVDSYTQEGRQELSQRDDDEGVALRSSLTSCNGSTRSVGQPNAALGEALADTPTLDPVETPGHHRSFDEGAVGDRRRHRQRLSGSRAGNSKRGKRRKRRIRGTLVRARELLSGHSKSSARHLATSSSPDLYEATFLSPPKTTTQVSPSTDQAPGENSLSNATLTRTIDQGKSSQASTLTKTVPDNGGRRGSSVVAGGKELGWTTDSAVVCWRRFLGLLGDFSHISNPAVLAEVCAYLDALTDSLLAINTYQPLEVTKSGAVKPPKHRPPLDYLVPVYLKVLQASPEFMEAKRWAIGIMQKIIITQHDVEPSEEMLAQFYRVLHYSLVLKEKDFTGEVIRAGCGKIFGYSLPGCSLLTLDFLQAVNEVLSQSSFDEALRTRAMTVLVTLLPFQSHFGPIKAFDPTQRDLTVKEVDDVMPMLASRLFQGVVSESSERARQVALCGLLTLCHRALVGRVSSSLSSAERGTALRTCLVLLLRCGRLASRAVALTAVSMLRALTECADDLFEVNPTYPTMVIQALAWNLAFLWSQAHTEEKLSPTFKMLLISTISALIDWTVKIPLPILTSSFVDLNKSKSDRSQGVTCLWVVFSVLEFIASSSSTGNSPQLEPAGPGWVPGCPIPDPIADEVEGKFADEIRPTSKGSGGGVGASGGGGGGGGARERNSDPLEMFSDQSYFVTSAPVTPESIRMAARFARCQLFYQLGRYPLSSTNDVMDSQVQEHHDRKLVGVNASDGMTFEAFDQPDVQVFVVNRSFLVSVCTVDAVSTAESAKNSWTTNTSHAINGELLSEKVVTDSRDVRVIVRDMAGKYAWDATQVYGLPPAGLERKAQHRAPSPPPRQRTASITFSDAATVSAASSSVSKANVDVLAKLLDDLESQHPGLYALHVDGGVDAADGFTENSPLEQWASSQVANAIKAEKRILESRHSVAVLPFYGKGTQDTADSEETEQWLKANRNYVVVKQLLCQLGFVSQSRRPSIELLKKSVGLVREIKNLDKQRPRQTYKIAVVYIGPGQEEKQEILSNARGSVEFERFAGALGWSVGLATHQGFTGGLQWPEDGPSATYFASPSTEVIFHVSTRMPSSSEEDRHRMFKHLGNDEVMIIWTEHWRPFRRSSLRTEFGDVLIIISPLPNGLFRIEIRKEPEIPFFGPLVDGAVVGEAELGFLVRATAVQASNAINSRKPSFQEHFEERCHYLQSIITNRMQSTGFEDFMMQLALPKPSPGQGGFSRRSASMVPTSIPAPASHESSRSPALPLKETSPRIRIRARASRDRSASVSDPEDIAALRGIRGQKLPLHSPTEDALPESVPAQTRKRNSFDGGVVDPAGISAANLPFSPAARQPQGPVRERLSLFNRISLRRKRRNTSAAPDGATNRQPSTGRVFGAYNR